MVLSMTRQQTFEDLLEATARQVGYHAGSYVPGMDREDVGQELAVVLWKVHGSYDPSLGSFANVLEVALRNKMEHLRRQGRRQVLPVVRLECRACGGVRAPSWRPTCGCGGRSFTEARSASALTSLDAALDDQGRDEDGWGAAARFEARYLGTTEPGYALVEYLR